MEAIPNNIPENITRMWNNFPVQNLTAVVNTSWLPGGKSEKTSSLLAGSTSTFNIELLFLLINLISWLLNVVWTYKSNGIAPVRSATLTDKIIFFTCCLYSLELEHWDVNPIQKQLIHPNSLSGERLKVLALHWLHKSPVVNSWLRNNCRLINETYFPESLNDKKRIESL